MGMSVDVVDRRVNGFAQTGLYRRYFKRFFDVALVVASAPFTIPLILAFAVLIKRDGGPAFYSQKRVGRGGRYFTCWKLRSMELNAELRLEEYLSGNPEARKEWDSLQKLTQDPRITAVGRFIRKTSIDELPQLLCILKGDMSFVGPRPFMPEQEALYPGTAYYKLRPGLTGFWQISDRNKSTFRARADFDTEYHDKLSLTSDLRVILQTVGVVFRANGM